MGFFPDADRDFFFVAQVHGVAQISAEPQDAWRSNAVDPDGARREGARICGY